MVVVVVVVVRDQSRIAGMGVTGGGGREKGSDHQPAPNAASGHNTVVVACF